MKKIVFTLAVTAIITGTIFTACLSSSQKVENAEDKVEDAQKAVLDAKSDLNMARQDSITEIQQFNTEFKNQISTNTKSIADLKVSIVNATKENKAIFEKKIAELEKRNNDLKMKLAEYNEGGTGQWQTFKSEFKHDLDELGNAFADFTVNNTK